MNHHQHSNIEKEIPVTVTVTATATTPTKILPTTNTTTTTAMEHNQNETSLLQPQPSTASSVVMPFTSTNNSIIDKDSENSIYIVCMDTYAALVVFVRHLISYECIFSIVLSVSCTVYIYYLIILEQDNEDNDGTSAITFNGNSMNWILLSFAIITPIGSIITMVYTRRESALQQISLLKSTLLELYTSYCIWNWDYKLAVAVTATAAVTTDHDHDEGKNGIMISNGRMKSSVNWLQFTDNSIKEILHLCEDVTILLTLPTDTRARHKTTIRGKKTASAVHTIHLQYVSSITKRFGRLAAICEVLKREGLPPNESNRIRQWERICLDAIERLRIIKMYRTPQGLRSFGRLFTMFLPPFYAPYYAQLSYDINSLGMGITFAIFTALALTSLFETISQMEDPFDTSSILDGIHVQNDLIDEFKPLLLALRDEYFPNSPPYEG